MDLTPERLDRLRIRARIRDHNLERPRCAGCGGDMPIFQHADIVTEQQMSEPGYWYLPEADFRPGDLICIWCIYDLLATTPAPYVWGHA